MSRLGPMVSAGIFLGIELGSVSQEIRNPPEKLQSLLNELHNWRKAHKDTKRKLLSLIASLRFAAKAVPAGRLFLRWLITLSTKVRKLHHHIRLNLEAPLTLSGIRCIRGGWSRFLRNANLGRVRHM